MTVKSLKTAPTFGFESENIHNGRDPKEYAKRNQRKALKYLPIIGNILGFKDYRSLHKEVKNDKARGITSADTRNVKRERLRYGIEGLGLGVVFLPLDLAASVKRKLQQLAADCKTKKTAAPAA